MYFSTKTDDTESKKIYINRNQLSTKCKVCDFSTIQCDGHERVFGYETYLTKWPTMHSMGMHMDFISVSHLKEQKKRDFLLPEWDWQMLRGLRALWDTTEEWSVHGA